MNTPHLMAWTRRRRRAASVIVVVLVGIVLLVPAIATAIEIRLKNSFIERFKNRVTIDAAFRVNKAHAHPNPPSKDGDMHVAGLAPEIGLATVAEVMNAAGDAEAVAKIHQLEGTGTPIQMSGAWRIWCEHGGGDDQVQGQAPDTITSTNPDHVFEIHPVTRMDSHSLVSTLRKTAGYQYKDAVTAFDTYENKPCRIRKTSGGTTTISTGMSGYNYVEFEIERLGDVLEVEDGFFAFCSVHDLDGELLLRKRRMAFVKESEPARKFLALQPGERLKVVGIPRISLTLVSWRARVSGDRPEVLTWNLPYEMIVVGAGE